MTVNLHTTKNNAIGLVQNNPLAAGGTNLIVNNSLDTKLQTLTFPFWLTIWANGLTPDTDSAVEIVEVTARPSPNNYTVTRARQGTSASQHNQNANVGLLWTAGNAQEVVTLDAVSKGYILAYDAVGIPRALAVGSDGAFIYADSSQTTGLKYMSVAGKGNIIVFNSSGIPILLAVGSDGKSLLADSSQTLGVKWAIPASTTQYSNGSGIINSTNGTTQTVTHNCPSTPQRIKFTFQNGDAGTGIGATAHMYGAGVWDSSGQNCITDYPATPNNYGGQAFSGSVMACHDQTANATPLSKVVISNITATTFDLTVTTGGFPPGGKYVFLFECEG